MGYTRNYRVRIQIFAFKLWITCQAACHCKACHCKTERGTFVKIKKTEQNCWCHLGYSVPSGTSPYHLVRKHLRVTWPRPEQSHLIPEACSPNGTDNDARDERSVFQMPRPRSLVRLDQTYNPFVPSVHNNGLISLRCSYWQCAKIANWHSGRSNCWGHQTPNFWKFHFHFRVVWLWSQLADPKTIGSSETFRTSDVQ